MKIEERLKFLAESNGNCSLLWAQWEFDKKLLTRALNTISRDFPHYSLHDSSHSSTIVTQIEKIIGPNIDKLSATDCWLLLESCYWHDAGMIVTNDEKKDLLCDPEFNVYLKNLSESHHELAIFAKNIIDGVSENKADELLNASNSLTFIIADYFRVKHAERSGKHVRNPLDINLESPRTSLIPRRLFDFVASIVECHGKNREEILKIPKRNDGVDSGDYAHPRYVASLLRVGDLLDIDDGRFCKTLLSNIGDVPFSSTDHQKKHASINHLYINSDVIEIRAECESYGSYSAQQSWFDYIQDEFDFQKRVWNEIVPDNSYVALPTIGDLTCEIKGYLAIDGRSPKISLDVDRIYGYITGALIYSEKYPYIRELVQNAIDATHYKVWEDLTYIGFDDGVDAVTFREKFNKLLRNEAIHVSVSKESETSDNVYYKVIVKDNGIGMSFDDIRKVLNVGSEVVTNRKKILANMPDWAKPSGHFGLGLQSVFRMCENISIKTKQHDGLCYLIEVENNKKTMPTVRIRSKKEWRYSGTEVTVFICADHIPKSISYDHIDLLEDFDPLIDNSIPVTPAIIKKAIVENFVTTPIIINFNKNSINGEKNDDSTNDFKWASDFSLGADFKLRVDIEGKFRTLFLYKGVEFELNILNEGVSGCIDIFSKNAGYWLTIDRKKGRVDRKKELISLCDDLVRNNSKVIIDNTENKSEADFFYYAINNITFGDMWKNYSICNNLVADYLFLDKDLYVCDSNLSGINNSGSYISNQDFKFRLLSMIVRRDNIGFNIDYVENKSFNRHGSEQLIDIHKISFIPRCNKKVDIEIIKKSLSSTNNQYTSRNVIPCFDDVFLPISIDIKDIPVWVGWGTNYCQLFDRFLFTPKVGLSKGFDLNKIFDFYKNKKILSVDRESFLSLYNEMWQILGFSD